MKLISLHNLEGVGHEFYNSFGKTAIAALVSVGVPLAYQSLDNVTLDHNGQYYAVMAAGIVFVRSVISALAQYADNKKSVTVVSDPSQVL